MFFFYLKNVKHAILILILILEFALAKTIIIQLLKVVLA